LRPFLPCRHAQTTAFPPAPPSPRCAESYGAYWPSSPPAAETHELRSLRPSAAYPAAHHGSLRRSPCAAPASGPLDTLSIARAPPRPHAPLSSVRSPLHSWLPQQSDPHTPRAALLVS